MWSNLPRKFNIAVSGGRDDFSHTHINDIGLQPCRHAVTGEMGFNVVLGGYMSTKRVAKSIDMNPNPNPHPNPNSNPTSNPYPNPDQVAESIDMHLWLPDDVAATVELSTAILRIFRDEGERKDLLTLTRSR